MPVWLSGPLKARAGHSVQLCKAWHRL